MIALRMFLRYLSKREITAMSSDQIELAKVSDRSLDLITPSELDRLLEAARGTDLKSLRAKAILEPLFFSLFSGARRVFQAPPLGGG